ncbi:MAG: hypothetical protein NTW79_02430 [Candidatus Berkelbacteria bacterium]|nr:hypothetical protein [Candidatus Berkelbacteria bacterium]
MKKLGAFELSPEALEAFKKRISNTTSAKIRRSRKPKPRRRQR